MGMFGARKRREILDRTDGLCAYCGSDLVLLRLDWQVDHMVPDSPNPDDLSNLVAACRSCNSRKQSKDVSEFREQVRTAMLEHVMALIGPYAAYYEPDVVEEFHQLQPRLTDLLALSPVVFELDRHGIVPGEGP